MRLPLQNMPSAWTLKRGTILIGFIFAMIGSIGAAVYVAPAQKQAGAIEGDIRELAGTIEILKNAAAEYVMFEQQGSLIFAVAAANTNEEARAEIAALRQLSLLDRTAAVRQIIGQLAIAGQLQYRRTSDAYQDLIDRARKDFTLDNFLAVKGFEKTIISRAETQSGQLQIRRTALIAQSATASGAVEHRELVLLVLNSLGSTLLLAANLIATREEAPRAA